MALVKYESTGRAPSLDVTLVERARGCPYCADGQARRVAERELTAPYTWRPIGYRCNMCGTVWLDPSVRMARSKRPKSRIGIRE